MSPLVNVNIKMDPEMKERMEKACAQIGLSMNAAFNIFAKKVGCEYRIPFEVSADPFFSEGNIHYLEQIDSDIKNGRAHFGEHELIEE